MHLTSLLSQFIKFLVLSYLLTYMLILMIMCCDLYITKLLHYELFCQPHLQRTKLCDMDDQELDPLYIERRDELKQIVTSMIKPKLLQGRTLNGKEFVSFLRQVIPLGLFFFMHLRQVILKLL